MALTIVRLICLVCIYSRLIDAKVDIISSDEDIQVGKDHVLLCKAGKDAEIKWLKDGEEIDENRHEVDNVDESSSKLQLKALNLEDSGTYKCLCTYLNNHEDSADLKLFVHEEIKFGSTQFYHEFLVNQTVHVPCVATGKPGVEIRWYRDNRLVADDGMTLTASLPCGTGHLRVLEDGTLQISNIQKMDHGKYICEAKIRGRRPFKRLNVSVVVNVPPTVKIHQERTSVLSGPQTNVTIVCLVTGFPAPLISWTTPPTSDSSRYIYNSDKSTLTIPAVARSDFGEYVCTGKNKLGEDSVEFILDVSEHPLVTLSDTEMAVKTGENVSVLCNATGHPKPTIQWFRNSYEDDMDTAKSSGRLIKDGAELVIENVSPSSGGLYTCIAKNEAGSTRKTFRLNTPPAVPRYFSVLPGPTSAHVTLHSLLQNGGSNITHYVIQWRTQSQEEWSETAIKYSDPLMVTSLAPYTEYSVRFAAQNRYFLGGFSDEKNIRTQAKREPDSPVISPSQGKLDGNSYIIPVQQLDDGGSPVTQYIVRYKMNKEGEKWNEKEMPGNTNSILLQDLHHNADYLMEIFAVNVNGSSKPAVLSFSVPQAASKPSLGKGGVVGIVMFIFLVLLVAVDAFCCYTNRCGLLNFLSRKLFGHRLSDAKALEEGVINNAAVDMSGLEKPSGSIPKAQTQHGSANGARSEVTCDKAPLTKFEKPPVNSNPAEA